jgi:transposase
MDAIFHLASTPGHPWRDLPAHYGKPDTVARFFRRLTHAGLWHRLLQALRECGPKHPLRSLEYAICRATRRAARLGGMNLLLLIRRLDLRSALNGPPWLLPNPLLSEMLARCPPPPLAPTKSAIEAARQHLKSLTWLQKAALGRKSIPRVVRFGWP